MILRTLSALSLVSLAACSGSTASGPGNTSSGFAPVNDKNQIIGNVSPDSSSGGGTSTGDIDKTEAGYTYLTESNGNEVAARAALINPGVITSRPTAGVGTYTALFEIAEIAGTDVSRDVTAAKGTIPVTVSFDTGRVEGRSITSNVSQTLTIAGQLAATGTGYTGTTTWRGVEGDLRGRANGDRIIGAFAGHDATSVYAGGLVGQGKTTP
ncbi:hypothetical protein ACOI1H_09360 [Loktanella sp. DJP18]|uniref:hypothetical protein n=1 Tax=Loktanella sp. DJP18 TaxID=3409788 RepID=UPI003BB68214